MCLYIKYIKYMKNTAVWQLQYSTLRNYKLQVENRLITIIIISLIFILFAYLLLLIWSLLFLLLSVLCPWWWWWCRWPVVPCCFSVYELDLLLVRCPLAFSSLLRFRDVERPLDVWWCKSDLLLPLRWCLEDRTGGTTGSLLIF